MITYATGHSLFWIIIALETKAMALNVLLIQQLEILKMIWLIHMVPDSFTCFSPNFSFNSVFTD